MIREHTRQRRDEISEVIGNVMYAQNWYQPGLKEAVLGPHSCDLVGVSRFYLKSTPPIVVDFEPSPLDRKFYLEEKRKFFLARGTAYVPVFLHERLTKEDFAKRVEEELAYLHTGQRIAKETQDLKKVSSAALSTQSVRLLVEQGRIGELFDRQEFEEWLDREARASVEAEIAAGRNLRGAAKNLIIRRTKEALINDLRKQAHDVRVDRKRSADESARAAQ